MKRIIVLFILTVFLGGCNVLEYPIFILFGAKSKKVKAEYTELAGKNIAIMIAGRPAIDFEYPYARLDLGLAAAQSIGQHVKGTSFVDQEKINTYQREDIDWYSLPISEIGKKFDSERIVYLDVLQFSMTEINSVNLLRARIDAELRVYDMESVEPDIDVYASEISIVYPEHAPRAMSESARMEIQRQSILLFAETLAQKFYDHKIPVK